MAKNWRSAAESGGLAKSLQGVGGSLLFGGGDGARETVALRTADILPNPDQPRRYFDIDELENLAASMRAVGQLSPILVKRHPNSPRQYLLVAGERRWRAAGLAGIATVSAHILEDSADNDQVALIENLQRVNLSPVEEAEGVQRLIERHSYSQEQAGGLLGRSRTEVNTTLSLLRLHPSIRQSCVTSHSNLPKAVLLEIARMSTAEQMSAWEQARNGGLTAREARRRRKETVEADDVPRRAAPGLPTPKALLASLSRINNSLRSAGDAWGAGGKALAPKEREALASMLEELDSARDLINDLLD
jgi:ParB family transcriptional regulator, chromosome partitioning protein